jgi:hypothetical protein
VHYFSESRIVLYFAAVRGSPQQESLRCVGAAVSTTGPAGPFVPQDQPILCAPNLGGAIDIENPELVYSGQRYFLFVSRDLYRTSDYKTSVLVSTKVDSGYANERAVLTAQNTNVSGPGGADILRTGDGRTIAFHHGWIDQNGRCDGYRPMYVSELAWDVNGRLPHLAQPTPGNPTCNV